MDSPEVFIPKKNLILDSQILSSLMTCARQADFRFNYSFVSVHGKPSYFEMGSIVHCFLEAYYRNIINGQTKGNAAGYAMTAAIEYAASSEVRNSSEEDKQIALSTCEQYLDRWKNDAWIPLEVETVKGRILYEDDEIRILWKAKFDWIVDTNAGVIPVDHKTSKQRRNLSVLNNQFKGQCILLDTRIMFINYIGFQKTLKPEEKFRRAPINYSSDALIEWQSTTLPYYAKLMLMYQESGYWPEAYGYHCEMCSFNKVCEADRNMREEILQHEFTVGDPWDITND